MILLFSFLPYFASVSWWVCVPMVFCVPYDFSKESVVCSVFLIHQALVEILNIQVLKIHGYLQNCQFVCATKSLQVPILLFRVRSSAPQRQCIHMIHWAAFTKDCSVFWETGARCHMSQGHCCFHPLWQQPNLFCLNRRFPGKGGRTSFTCHRSHPKSSFVN